MKKIPPFWRRLSRMILFNDLMTGRRVIRAVTMDDGQRIYYMERVKNPIPPLDPTFGLTNDSDSDTMVEIDK